MITQVKST